MLLDHFTAKDVTYANLVHMPKDHPAFHSASGDTISGHSQRFFSLLNSQSHGTGPQHYHL